MTELLKVLAQGLVEQPDQVSVVADEPNSEGVVILHLHVAPSDMGRVIGRQGRIAKAIRSIMRGASARAGQRIVVEID